MSFKIGDIVQLYTDDNNDFKYEPTWSECYEIYGINDPNDKQTLGYCHQKSYWLRSLCGEWQRTWFNEHNMRKVDAPNAPTK